MQEKRNKIMKKYLLFILIKLTTYVNALTWYQLKSWGNKNIEPDVKYNIETEGYNVRVYEFTPISDPGSTCIMTITN